MSALSTDASARNGIRAALAIGGALALLFGLIILIWPEHAAAAVALIIGIYAIAGGLVYAGLGLFARGMSGWSRVGHVVLGVLYVIAGVVIFTNLAAATATLAVFIGVLIGIVWLVEGVVALTTLGDSSSRGWTLFFAIVSILAGISLLVSPLVGAAILWLFVGVSAVVIGILQLVRAYQWGRA